MSLLQPQGRQREVICLPATGHTVVLGTAGSGKTTMAALRANYLAQLTSRPVLLVTYNRALLTYLKAMAEEQQVSPLVEARTYHHFARGYLKHKGLMEWNIIAEGRERRNLITLAVQEARAAYPDEPILQKPIGFFEEECEWIAGCSIRDIQEFRRFRKTSDDPIITDQTCDAIFQVYQSYLTVRSQTRYSYDWADLAQVVDLNLAEDQTDRRYGHVVIDEGQDFTPAVLRSLTHLIPPDGSLTFFGDMAQQIYGARISWRDAGIKPPSIWHFRENYRNTGQIADLCLALTRTPTFVGDADLVTPNLPQAAGPLPALVHFHDLHDEREFVLRTARSLEQQQSLAVLVRRQEDERFFLQALRRENVQHLSREMVRWNPVGVSVGTYHAAKGMEFDTVILPYASAERIPDPDRLQSFAHVSEGLAQESRILYVGLSRARTRLIVTYTGTVTPLLPQEDELYQRFER